MENVYYAICPLCGKRLCRAAEGSIIEIQCPACKGQVTVEVSSKCVRTGIVRRAVKPGEKPPDEPARSA